MIGCTGVFREFPLSAIEAPTADDIARPRSTGCKRYSCHGHTNKISAHIFGDIRPGSEVSDILQPPLPTLLAELRQDGGAAATKPNSGISTWLSPGASPPTGDGGQDRDPGQRMASFVDEQLRQPVRPPARPHGTSRETPGIFQIAQSNINPNPTTSARLDLNQLFFKSLDALVHDIAQQAAIAAILRPQLSCIQMIQQRLQSR